MAFYRDILLVVAALSQHGHYVVALALKKSRNDFCTSVFEKVSTNTVQKSVQNENV